MTQAEFDRLPLLLRYAQVVAVLEGVNRRSLLESIGDGTLRRWPAAPVPFRIRYYLKEDVAAMAGLRMQAPVLARLQVWMSREELLRLLGLGQNYFWAAARLGVLRCDHEPRSPWRLRLRVREFAALQTGSSRVDAKKTLTTDGHG